MAGFISLMLISNICFVFYNNETTLSRTMHVIYWNNFIKPLDSSRTKTTQPIFANIFSKERLRSLDELSIIHFQLRLFALAQNRKLSPSYTFSMEKNLWTIRKQKLSKRFQRALFKRKITTRRCVIKQSFPFVLVHSPDISKKRSIPAHFLQKNNLM